MLTTVDANARTGFDGTVHFPGTETAALVETRQMKQVGLGFASLAQHGGVVTVDGKPGLGKTTATKLLGRQLNMDKRLLAMPNRPKGKETTARIHAALSGQRTDMRLSEYVLLEEVVDMLEGRPVALAIDEAQHLNIESLRQLRWLQDHDRTNLVLIIVGVNVTSAPRSKCPELENRVQRRISFAKYSRAEMAQFMKKYHPLYANSSPDAMQTLLDAVQGNLRNCATLLVGALNLGADPQQGLDKKTAAATIRAVQGARS